MTAPILIAAVGPCADIAAAISKHFSATTVLPVSACSLTWLSSFEPISRVLIFLDREPGQQKITRWLNKNADVVLTCTNGKYADVTKGSGRIRAKQISLNIARGAEA